MWATTLRLMGFAVGLVASTATPAKAVDATHGLATAGIENVQMRVAATRNDEGRAERPAVTQLQIGGALGLRQPLGHVPTTGHSQASEAMLSTTLAALSAGRSAGWEVPGLTWFQLRGSGLTVPVTDRLSLGVAYRHSQAENVMRTLALGDTPDHGSHAVFLQANWDF